MSTPIEIVREYVENRVHVGIGTDEQNAALASVLADAERFKALERAHKDDDLEIWVTGGLNRDYVCTLSELADRLREVKP